MPTLRITDINGNQVVMLRPAVPRSNDSITCPSIDLGFSAHRENMYERAGQSGSIDLTQFHGPRTITADLRLRTINGYTKEGQLALLERLSAPANRFYVIAQRDGWETERRMLCRTTNLSCVSTRASAAMFTVALSFVCPSGEMESATELSQYAQALVLAGLESPLIFPSTGVPFPAGSSNNIATVDNKGNAPSPPHLVIHGPAINPSIRNDTTKQEFTLDGMTVPENHFLDINFENHTVFMDNSPAQSFYGYVDWNVSSWWSLAPGINKIVYETTSGQLQIRYRSRWS